MKFLLAALLLVLASSASQFRTLVANPNDSAGAATVCADPGNSASCNIRSAVQWCLLSAVAEGDECTISMQAGLSAIIDASFGEISISSSHMSMIIDGNDATIDSATDSSSLFFSILNSPLSNITFHNLTITNFKSTADGAAIYVSDGGNIYLSAVKFENNSCTRGCGLFVQEAQYVFIVRCTFSMNEASSVGSGMSFQGPIEYVEISNSIFSMNNETALNFQGQIAAVNKTLIADCEFTDNFSEGIAAAMLLDVLADSITILRSRFARQHVGYDGGAVYLSATDAVTFIDCEFEDNNADQSGGAVYVVSSRNTVFDSCTFRNNTAYFAAGAVYLTSSKGNTFILCNFIQNKVYLYGGALNFFESNFDSAITGSNFSSNQAVGDGSAIRLDKYNINTEVTDCLFTNNTCDDSCSTFSISSLNSVINVFNSVFLLNYSPSGSTVITGRANTLFYVLNSTFIGNKGGNGKIL